MSFYIKDRDIQAIKDAKELVLKTFTGVQSFNNWLLDTTKLQESFSNAKQ